MILLPILFIFRPGSSILIALIFLTLKFIAPCVHSILRISLERSLGLLSLTRDIIRQSMKNFFEEALPKKINNINGLPHSQNLKNQFMKESLVEIQ